MNNLRALAEQIEQSGTDTERELLEAAFEAIFGPIRTTRLTGAVIWNPQWFPFKKLLDVDAYLSAALMMVPEYWCKTVADFWEPGGEDRPSYYADCGDLQAIRRGEDGAVVVEACGNSEALALAAACLRAHAVLREREEGA